MTIVSRLELPKFKISSFKIERYDVVRIILGLVLLTAAALKGYQLATEPTLEKGLLTSRWFLILEVEFEIAFGLLLLSGLYRRLTWVVAIACFSIFSLVTFDKGISGEATCGCFGEVEINPWYTLIFDLTAVITLLIFRPQRQHQPFHINLRPTIILAVLVLLIGLPSAHAMISYTPTIINENGFIEGNGNIVVLEPEKWIGKPLPLLKYIDIGNQLASGEWIVVLYHYDCLECQVAITKYEHLAYEWKKRSVNLQIALIEVPPYGNKTDSLVSVNSNCTRGHLNDNKEWFIKTPSVFQSANGMVRFIDGMPLFNKIFTFSK